MKETTRKYVELAPNRKFYEHHIPKLGEAEQEQLDLLVGQLAAAGARNPLPWAYSQATEGIPQLERFLVLKYLYLSALDIEGNIDAGHDFDRQLGERYKEIADVVGNDKLQHLLLNYGKGMLYNLLGVIDEGNTDYESDVSWQLLQYDRGKEQFGRGIGGLHEDFMEFHDEIELPGVRKP